MLHHCLQYYANMSGQLLSTPTTPTRVVDEVLRGFLSPPPFVRLAPTSAIADSKGAPPIPLLAPRGAQRSGEGHAASSVGAFERGQPAPGVANLRRIAIALVPRRGHRDVIPQAPLPPDADAEDDAEDNAYEQHYDDSDDEDEMDLEVAGLTATGIHLFGSHDNRHGHGVRPAAAPAAPPPPAIPHAAPTSRFGPMVG